MPAFATSTSIPPNRSRARAARCSRASASRTSTVRAVPSPPTLFDLCKHPIHTRQVAVAENNARTLAGECDSSRSSDPTEAPGDNDHRARTIAQFASQATSRAYRFMGATLDLRQFGEHDGLLDAELDVGEMPLGLSRTERAIALWDRSSASISTRVGRPRTFPRALHRGG